LGIIPIGGFDEIGGIGRCIGVHAATDPVDINGDTLDESYDEEKPSHSAEKLHVEINSYTEMFQLVCVLKGVQLFLNNFKCT